MQTVTMRGNTLHLEGQLPEVGAPAPGFTLLANDLSPKTLTDYLAKTVIILAVPSLDTGVCDMEVRHFNTEAGKLSDNVRVLAVSCDLPFAQKRWCGAAGVEHVEALSDHRDLSFGKQYGVLISELRLLARAVFVINREGTLVYSELVPEVSHEPNYEAALEAARKAL